jgi:hypothetical protein
MSRCTLACLAMVAAGVAVVDAPALARGGSGGHVGFGRGIAARGHLAGATPVYRPARVAIRRARPAFPAPFSFYRPPAPIQPLVIAIPSGAMISPPGQGFVAPIVGRMPAVWPIGVPAIGPEHARFPVVRTPVFSGPHDVRLNSASESAVPGSIPTVIYTGASNGLPTACRPISNGYHCDWLS